MPPNSLLEPDMKSKYKLMTIEDFVNMDIENYLDIPLETLLGLCDDDNFENDEYSILDEFLPNTVIAVRNFDKEL